MNTPYHVETVTEIWTARFLPAEAGRTGRWRITGPERSNVKGHNETSGPYQETAPVGVVIGGHTEQLRDIVASAAGGLVSDIAPAIREDADPLSGWHPTVRLTVIRPAGYGESRHP